MFRALVTGTLEYAGRAYALAAGGLVELPEALAARAVRLHLVEPATGALAQIDSPEARRPTYERRRNPKGVVQMANDTSKKDSGKTGPRHVAKATVRILVDGQPFDLVEGQSVELTDAQASSLIDQGYVELGTGKPAPKQGGTMTTGGIVEDDDEG